MCSVVLLFSHENPVIWANRLVLPGPVKLATSLATEKLVGSIALLKVKSNEDTDVVWTPVGLCEVTRGLSRPIGRSVAVVMLVALELLSTALKPNPRRANAVQIWKRSCPPL